jgi:ketosteroid isomerase-like protein
MNASNALIEEVARLNRQWMESYVRGDVGFLERYLSDDYSSTFPDGSVLDKKGEIEALKSRVIALEEMTPREMKVRLYGETAVITGQSTIRAKAGGREISGEYRFIDIWVKRSEGWSAVASQVTRVNKSEDAAS